MRSLCISICTLAILTTAGCAHHRTSEPTTAQASSLPRSTDPVPFSPRPLIMVKIPAGAVQIGEGPSARTVQVRSIWISVHELTWSQFDPWDFCLDLPPNQAMQARAISRPSELQARPFRGWFDGAHPARFITYPAAETYCQWLSQQTGKRYRLPTEAEWEYACIAGKSATEPQDHQLESIAWFRNNSANAAGQPEAQTVGLQQPNAWGVHDMLGNVAEWVVGADGRPVLKGGSFMDDASTLDRRARVLYNRDWQASDPQLPKSRWWLSDGPFAGFRVVRED